MDLNATNLQVRRLIKTKGGDSIPLFSKKENKNA
jgi:hypothetical protein